MIENSFGILVSKWRIFRKPIEANTSTVRHIVKATVSLHNWLRKYDFENPEFNYLTPEIVDSYDSNGRRIDGTWRGEEAGGLVDASFSNTRNHTRKVAAIREKFMKYFSNEGAVGWQYDHI